MVLLLLWQVVKRRGKKEGRHRRLSVITPSPLSCRWAPLLWSRWESRWWWCIWSRWQSRWWCIWISASWLYTLYTILCIITLTFKCSSDSPIFSMSAFMGIGSKVGVTSPALLPARAALFLLCCCNDIRWARKVSTCPCCLMGSKKGCCRASKVVTRFDGLNWIIDRNKSMASSFDPGNFNRRS